MINTPKQTLTHWMLPLVLVVICVAIQIMGRAEALRYERTLIAVEPWRLVSGHLATWAGFICC